MVKSVRIITTDIKNPWINLALEEHFLNTNPEGNAILFLWQNKDTVVIGRNQNPWTECNLPLMQEDNIRLARRITGGGAVFHDIGNLNFSFILNREDYDVRRQCMVIIKALEAFGIKAAISGRNDMTVDEKKFSGNAFGFRSRNALHHGTILIGADKEKMAKYLTVSTDKIKSKGVTSVKSRVMNLCDILPELTVVKVKEAVAASFIEEYGQSPEKVHFSEKEKQFWPKDPAFRSIITRNSSWEWSFGETPDFDMTLKNRFSWGGIELHFKLDEGIVTKAEVFSDSLYEELVTALPGLLTGARLTGEELSQKLNNGRKELTDLMKDAEVKDLVFDDLVLWLKDALK
ncbi:MAG: lipoate--protein ligase [Clostridia bacterium]|nr:lipoate--protein ligase [Clostridia bacterium]